MSKQGQYNFKGINSQAWAAMSLFLQFISKPDFSHIIFEGNKLEDFCLVFNDGKKIVCESKDHTSGVGYSKLKDILGNVVKHEQINSNDEILIVCPSVDQNVLNDIEHVKYLKEYTKNKLINKHKFAKDEVALLPQVRFWQINQAISQSSVEALISYLLGIWVPRHVLSEIVCNFMVVEVYFGSQKGQTLTKKDLLEKLEERKKQAVSDSTYEEDRGVFDKRLEKFIKLVRNPPADSALTNNQITNLSSRPNEYSFLIDRLKGKDLKINLKTWNSFWISVVQGIHSFNVFDIFENNLNTKENISYATDFCLEFFDQNYNLIRDEFINTDIAKLCGKILDLTNEHNTKIFEVIQKLLKPKLKEYFYEFSSRDKQWEIGEITGVLEKLYDKSDKTLKQGVIKYILDSFNISEDEGSLWDNASPGMFRIVKNHFEQDPEKGIKKLTEIISDQYTQNYSKFGKKLDFKGWEHFGMSISNFGENYTVGDHHFVHQLLQPILSDYYSSQPEKAWQFIIKSCVSRKIADVKPKKPDFLNRSSIPILLTEYHKGKHSKEAFDILSDFIKMRRGIPWKNDLIFQELKNNTYSDDKKWKLIKISLAEFKNLPINVFVEQIIFDLASKNYPKAFEVIEKWIKNPRYNVNHFMGSYGPTDGIPLLLENNPDVGIKLFLNYISSNGFKEKLSPFDTYDLAKSLAKIIEDNPDKGIKILKDIYKSKRLTINQQILIFASINNIADDKKKIIKQIYDFLYPILKSFKSNEELEKRIPHREARENIAMFTEKIAKNNYFEEALDILEILTNDSDPPENGSNYPNDKNGDFNYHKKLEEGEDPMVITTVRGWCAHVLSQFSRLGAEEYIPKAVGLLEKLTKNPNNYVRYESCIPLEGFAKNRRSIIPNTNKLFIDLETAQKIEEIVFSIFENEENHKIKALMKRLVNVLGNMRGIPQNNAKALLDIIIKTGYDEVIADSAPLFIYFAEFRKKDFKGKQFMNVYNKKEYEDMQKYDSSVFKKILNNLIAKGSVEIKSKLSWQFWQLPNEKKNNKGFIKISIRYFKKLIKSGYSHEVFEMIYHFINDYLDQYPKECLGLWKKCVKKEKPALFKLAQNKTDLDKYYWFPNHYNGKVLVKLLEIEGIKVFLYWFDFILSYPEETSMAMDINLAVDELKKINSNKEKIGNIFDKLMARDPKFYNDKKEWLKNIKIKNEKS